jgi:hypothetical protein
VIFSEVVSQKAIFDGLKILSTIALKYSLQFEFIGMNDVGITLSREIYKRLYKYEYAFRILIKAALLNPIVNIEEVVPFEKHPLIEEVKSEIRRELPLRRIIENQRKVKFGEKQSIEYSNEFDEFFGSPFGQYKNAIEFWLGNTTNFPNLSKIALDLSLIPTSSATVERLFSRCRCAISYNQSNSNLETINNKIMLMYNEEWTEKVVNEFLENPRISMN